MEKRKTIGTKMPRIDARDKVLGKTLYSADINLPGMLCGKVLKSPLPHARIKNIDISKAKKVKGVKAVVTADDIEKKRMGIIMEDEPILAFGKVRYVGERVAAVAAVDEDTATEALSLIKVEYEELKPVFDPLEAMEPEAPLVHDDLFAEGKAQNMGIEGNICSSMEVPVGDLDKGFAESDYIFEDTFRTQMVHQGYIEPHAVVADFDFSGGFSVWTCTQGYFYVQKVLAKMFKIPTSRVKVFPIETGGGFGGKIFMILEPIAVLLSKTSGRPVKMVMSMEEEFATLGRPRYASIVKLKTGVKKDGRILAKHARLYYDLGAFAGFGPILVFANAMNACGPYKVPNAKLEGYCIYTNKLYGTCFRAPGAPQMNFAVESQMDMIARELGKDPVEFRLINGVREGDLLPSGTQVDNSSLLEMIEKAGEAIKIKEPKRKNCGKGVAACIWSNRPEESYIYIKLNEDSTLSVFTGVSDLTGARTIFSQIVAEELNINPDAIFVISPDTTQAPLTPSTTGSGTTYNTGFAARSAAIEFKAMLFEVASELLKVPKEDLDTGNGKVFIKDNEEKAVTFRDIYKHYQETKRGPLIAKNTSITELQFPLFGAQAVEVKVDTETGKVEVEKVVAVHDVGKVINPLTVEGQIEGGVSQGLGFALSEEVKCSEGKVTINNFSDYGIPTSLDVPDIEVVILETPSKGGPYGVKGIGEPPIIPTAAAIANAVYDAVGVRIKELPMTPERVLKAIKEKENSKS